MSVSLPLPTPADRKLGSPLRETRRQLSEAIQRFDNYRDRLSVVEAADEEFSGRDGLTLQKIADEVADTTSIAVERVEDLAGETGRRLEPIVDNTKENIQHRGLTETTNDYLDITKEGRDLLLTIDFPRVPDAVDLDKLPDTIDTEAVRQGKLEKTVRPKEALLAVDLFELPNVVDIPNFLKEKRELDEAISKVREGTHDEEGGSILSDVAGSMGFDGGDGGTMSMPTEVLQTALPSKLDDGIGRFREGLLETHERLEQSSERVQKQVGSVDQPSSRNPSAYSTLSVGRGIIRGAPTFSVVPRKVRHSVTQGRERLYGTRLERAATDG